MGIPKDKQELIFEAFVQADGSTTRHHGGTGLGLGICLKLVEQMHGKIWVESTPGKGSVFHFTALFPVSKTAASSIETTDTRRGVPSTKTLSRPLRILIAEDNPVNQAVALGILQKEGHTLTVAKNGLEAVRLSQLERPDLILMDVQMPELDGIEATREIRAAEEASGSRTPIVAMTAHAMAGDAERCLEAGMDAHLAKPLDKDVLLSTIASIVENNDPAPAPADADTPSLSRATLLDSLDGDTLLLDKVTTLFNENTPAYLAQMRRAIKERDGIALEKSAHTLLSSLGVFRAHRAIDITTTLQAAGKSHNFAEAEQHLTKLENETRRICTTIGSHA
jgi:CheY-like chemotaxis protein/HPt (histidine-containing phosphotransfer) domain-containing protein